MSKTSHTPNTLKFEMVFSDRSRLEGTLVVTDKQWREFLAMLRRKRFTEEPPPKV